MKTITTILSVFLFVFAASAQSTISGTIKDKKGAPIIGANIYVKDTYDGASSSENGSFSFITDKTGKQILVASFIGFKNKETEIDLSTTAVYDIILEEEINKLTGVVITAGSFQAGDEQRSIVMKPLDIVTTAGATADISGALNTLPGTQTVGETGRLFVRGGESYEAKTFVDGMQVLNEYNATTGNIPTRNRFSPMMFTGTNFSTGGYSAEYGQALSSALVLNTKNEYTDTRTDLGFMSLGLDAAHTQVWDKTSLAAKVEYTNLAPYMNLINQRFDWEKAPESFSGTIAFRQKLSKTGILKFFGTGSASRFIILKKNIDKGGAKERVDLGNKYLYLNTSYKDIINDKWTYKTGLSYTKNNDDIGIESDDVGEAQEGVHAKMVFTGDVSNSTTLKFGTEYFHRKYDFGFISTSQNIAIGFDENIGSAFAEANIFLSNDFVLGAGARMEYSSLVDALSISPRMSLAYKTSEKSQISMAYGQFHQTAQNQYVRVNNNLESEKADHYIVNYEHKGKGQVFRAEGFYKDYHNLVKFDPSQPFTPSSYTNAGDGYAKGFDLFWRDEKTLKNVEYWVSYSFLDTKRNFQDYPELAVPKFFSKHNVSVVYKQFISKIKSQIGWSYTYASGRPYNNPNEVGFNKSRTPEYHNISLNMTYLWKQNLLIHGSVQNLLGIDNVFGYQYSNKENDMGIYDRQAVKAGAKRFIFIGVFFTFSKDKDINQLRSI